MTETSEGDVGTKLLMTNVIYLILALAFLGLMLLYLYNQSNGAQAWSDIHAKEITRIINTGSPGDKITIDVQHATKIALNNGVSSRSEIVTINNKENEICVKLSPGRATCYKHFTNLDIINNEIKLDNRYENNILTFDLVEKPQNEIKT